MTTELDDLKARIQAIEDRNAIYDCITTYARAMDRLDRDLLFTVYHPDAIDDHGIFVGGIEEFADWGFAYHRAFNQHTTHMLCNFRCEIDGDVAHTETYFIYACTDQDDKTQYPAGGRYIDRFERRDGRWAIAARKCVTNWNGQPGEVTRWSGDTAKYDVGPNTRDRTDSSYERPLTIDQTRIGQIFPLLDPR